MGKLSQEELSAYFSQLGKKSYKARLAKYGPNHMSDMAKGREAKKRAKKQKELENAKNSNRSVI